LPFIVCDTDFLIKATSQPVPALASFLSEFGYQLSTLPRIEQELRGLSLSKTPTTARKAKSALRTISTGTVKLLKDKDFNEKTDADSILIEFASRTRENVVVATLDHTLLSILERRRLPYLTLRNDRPILKIF